MNSTCLLAFLVYCNLGLYFFIKLCKYNYSVLGHTHDCKVEHMLTRSRMYDARGNGAIKELAKRRIEYVTGNINSYSRFLNSPERPKEVQDNLQLCADVTKIPTENEDTKSQKKMKKEAEAAEREK